MFTHDSEALLLTKLPTNNYSFQCTVVVENTVPGLPCSIRLYLLNGHCKLHKVQGWYFWQLL